LVKNNKIILTKKYFVRQGRHHGGGKYNNYNFKQLLNNFKMDFDETVSSYQAATQQNGYPKPSR